ncbi:hypothetical protein AVEN_81352-1 [Araneus ventricosus]|uniref:Uncharacterized protein n=1 Tax=Araneus ventricosus TaxID=182803 RepID=A0A4Y2B6T0_ARAVE|nr:hypothetical protein AVEN_81352-1 [Araneus ventricosus]
MSHNGSLNLLQRENHYASVKMATVQHKARLELLWFHEGKLIVRVQRHFRAEYRNCQSPLKNSIKCWYEQFKGTGNVCPRKFAGWLSVSDEVVERMRETFTP